MGNDFVKKEYQIITNDDVIAFRSSVNFMLEQGWVLQGGISLSENWYAQAVYRETQLEEG